MAPDTVKLNRELGEVDIRSYRAGHDQGSRTALAEMAGKLGVEAVRHTFDEHDRDCEIPLTTAELVEAIRQKLACSVEQDGYECDWHRAFNNAERAFVQQVAGMLGVDAEHVESAGGALGNKAVWSEFRTLDEVLQEAFTHFARMVRMDAFEGLPPHQMAEAFLARNTKGGA